MTRILGIWPTETGYEIREGGGGFVADFPSRMLAQRFVEAEVYGPSWRVHPTKRRTLQRVDTLIGGQWYVIDTGTPDRECVGTFRDQDDADLFVTVYRP